MTLYTRTHASKKKQLVGVVVACGLAVHCGLWWLCVARVLVRVQLQIGAECTVD